jgi:hypothetical protein
MGVRFLWVDSFCIVQDSQEDKDREIPKMASIYKNAHFTLVAARAQTVDEGFLEYRAPPPANLIIPYGGTEDKSGFILLRGEYSLLSAMHDRPDATELRGWCLQESILSHRCLTYSTVNLYWSCLELPYAHSVPGSVIFHEGGTTGGWQHVAHRLPNTSHDSRSRENFFDGNWLEIWKFWRVVVEEYTRRELSDPKDKLHAVAGIATEIEKLCGAEYMAGLWKQDLLAGILWLSNYMYHGHDSSPSEVYNETAPS